MDPVYKDVPKAMFLLMIVLVKYWFICTNIFISINIHGSWFHNTLKDIHFTRNLCDKCFASIFILHCIQLYYTNCDHFCILVHNDENIYIMFFFSVCANGKYILNRECVTCSSYCKNYSLCNKSTGKCDIGCSDHRTGDFCPSIFNSIDKVNRYWTITIKGIKGICQKIYVHILYGFLKNICLFTG